MKVSFPSIQKIPAGEYQVNHICRTAVAAAIFAGLTWTAAASAQTKEKSAPNTVIEVRVEGNKVLSESAVLSDVKTRPGQPYSEQVVRDDEQRLLKTRRYANIVATKTQTDKGIIVTFTVTERPLIEAVIFEGNKVFKDSTLAAMLTFGGGDPIDKFRIESGKRSIQSKYRSSMKSSKDQRSRSEKSASRVIRHSGHGNSKASFQARRNSGLSCQERSIPKQPTGTLQTCGTSTGRKDSSTQPSIAGRNSPPIRKKSSWYSSLTKALITASAIPSFTATRFSRPTRFAGTSNYCQANTTRA
jgi:hypothetical protein